MLHIRTATPEDATVLALLGRVTYAESHGHFIQCKTHLLNYGDEAFAVSKIKSELNDPTILYHIVTYDDFPVGYSKIVLHASREEINSENICRLERIYILDDFISKKIGIQLLNKIIEESTALEFEKIWLTVYIKNQRAIRFYEKNDFKTIGQMDYYVDGVPYENIVLAKNLIA